MGGSFGATSRDQFRENFLQTSFHPDFPFGCSKMSKSSKRIVKSLGEKIGGSKGSSSKKDKEVRVPPPKKVTRVASPEIEAMEVDIPTSSSVARRPGKGKSLKVIRESMNPLDQVRRIIDGEEIGEVEETELP